MGERERDYTHTQRDRGEGSADVTHGGKEE